MEEREHIEAEFNRWARPVLLFLGLSFVGMVWLAWQGRLEWGEAFDPFYSAIILLFISRKKSRVAAALTVIVYSIGCADDALLSAGYDPFFISDTLSHGSLTPAFAIYEGVLIIIGLKAGMLAQRFHADVKSRLVFRNVIFTALISFAYILLGFLIIYFLVRMGLVHAQTESESELYQGLYLLSMFFLIMWRFLPGLGRFPTVVWGKAAEDMPHAFSISENFISHVKLVNTQRGQEGHVIVSPGGWFATSYQIDGKDFPAYKKWHEGQFRWGQKSIFPLMLVIILLSMMSGRAPSPWDMVLIWTPLIVLVGVTIFIIRLIVKKFRTAFPQARVAKASNKERLRRLVYSAGATPVIGSYAFALIGIIGGVFMVVPAYMEIINGMPGEISPSALIGSGLFGTFIILFYGSIGYVRFVFKKRHGKKLTFKSLEEALSQ